MLINNLYSFVGEYVNCDTTSACGYTFPTDKHIITGVNEPQVEWVKSVNKKHNATVYKEPYGCIIQS